MSTSDASTGTLFQANLKLVWSVFLGVISFSIWPISLEWWAFGFISIVLALGGMRLSIEGFGAILAHRKRTKTFAEYQKLGGDQTSAELADNDKIRDGGMF